MALTITRDMAASSQAYFTFKGLLDRVGPAKLQTSERELLMDAADAILFDEEDAPVKRQRAHDLLDHLIASDRWISETAQSAKDYLDAIQ